MSLIFTFYFFYNHFVRYKYFKVMETSTSQLVEGAKNASSFLTCRIKLMTKRPLDQLVFDELWIDDRLYKIKITNEENEQVQSPYQKKQILYIHVESEVSQPSALPPSDKNASKIMLGYQVDNKRKYYVIKDFSEDMDELEVA